MKAPRADFTKVFLDDARHVLGRVYFPRIESCLDRLSDREVWRRSHPTSNSVGNMVLHLAGNVRQWIISGLGGALDRRDRDREFAERGPISRRRLKATLGKAVREASGVLRRLRAGDLARRHTIQKFNVTGLVAVSHVMEHFAYHAGQIIFVTKSILGEDLGFTRLPGEKTKRRKGKKLPAV